MMRWEILNRIGDSIYYQLFSINQISIKMNTLESSYIPYTLIQKLGAGTSGDVHKAISTKTGKKFAIKQIPNQIDIGIDIHPEIQIHKSLKNQHIVEFIQSFQLEKQSWIVMELCESNLHEIMKKRKLATTQILKIAIQILKTMIFLHQNNVAHLDLKPENVLISGDLCIKLTDFGCSSFHSSINSKKIFGTSNYMPPQVRLGMKQQDPMAIDVWSFGVLLYEMLHHQYPIKNDKELSQIWSGKRAIRYAKIDQQEQNLLIVLKRILEVNPKNRPKLSQIKFLFIQLLNRDEIEFKQIAQITNQHLETNKLFYSIIETIELNIYYHTNQEYEYDLGLLERLSKELHILGYLYSVKFFKLFGEISKKNLPYSLIRNIRQYSEYFGTIVEFDNQDEVNMIGKHEAQVQKLVRNIKPQTIDRIQMQFKSIKRLSIFFNQVLELPKPDYFCCSIYFPETIKILNQP